MATQANSTVCTKCQPGRFWVSAAECAACAAGTSFAEQAPPGPRFVRGPGHRQIQRFEPRITLLNLDVTIEPDVGSAHATVVKITITGLLKPTNQPLTTTFALEFT